MGPLRESSPVSQTSPLRDMLKYVREMCAAMNTFNATVRQFNADNNYASAESAISGLLDVEDVKTKISDIEQSLSQLMPDNSDSTVLDSVRRVELEYAVRAQNQLELVREYIGAVNTIYAKLTVALEAAVLLHDQCDRNQRAYSELADEITKKLSARQERALAVDAASAAKPDVLAEPINTDVKTSNPPTADALIECGEGCGPYTQPSGGLILPGFDGYYPCIHVIIGKKPILYARFWRPSRPETKQIIAFSFAPDKNGYEPNFGDTHWGVNRTWLSQFTTADNVLHSVKWHLLPMGGIDVPIIESVSAGEEHFEHDRCLYT